jgi:hypothetical protein
MADSLPLTRRANLAWGLALVALSLLIDYLIFSQPEKLHAPAWVAYIAASAFLLAGVQLVATAAGAKRVTGWLAVGCVFAMWVPALWIACRSVFGFSAVVGAAIICMYVRHLIVSTR